MKKIDLPVFKMSYLICFVISLLLLSHSAFAELKTFVKEYTYQAGDEDSRNSCRTIALREVKRLLLEQLGTYLESQTEVKNFQMTKDQITTLTAGIVSTEVIEDTWDGKKYWLKAKISANPQDVIKSINNLRKDTQKVKEYEELRKISEELLRENARLNKDIKAAKGGKKLALVAKAYKKNIDNLSATEWLEKGDELCDLGKYTDGIAAFSKAIALNPQFKAAYHRRGHTYLTIGNYQQAIKDNDKAIELDPQGPRTYVNRGLVYYQLGNFQQAVKDNDKAIELDPRGSLAYVNRGNANTKLGNNQQAIEDYSKAIELEPNFAGAYYNRGLAYNEIGNFQQAIKDYSKAIGLEPQLASAYYMRGKTYNYEIGNFQQAIKDFDKAIELDPKDKHFYVQRGSAYRELGNHQQVIKDFDKAIELDPQYALAYYVRGVGYYNLGNAQRGLADIKTAARLGDETAINALRSKGIEW